MVQVSWTDQALEDLKAICLFISRDSPRIAELFADKIFAATDRLVNFPLMGRIVPELNQKDIREIIHGNYRIIYRVLGSKVEILTVHHGARLLRLDSFEKFDEN